MHPGQVAGGLKFDFNARKLDLVGSQVDGFLEELLQVEGLQLGAAFAGKVQQVADNFFGALSLIDHITDHFFALLIVQGIIVF